MSNTKLKIAFLVATMAFTACSEPTAEEKAQAQIEDAIEAVQDAGKETNDNLQNIDTDKIKKSAQKVFKKIEGATEDITIGDGSIEEVKGSAQDAFDKAQNIDLNKAKQDVDKVGKEIKGKVSDFLEKQKAKQAERKEARKKARENTPN